MHEYNAQVKRLCMIIYDMMAGNIRVIPDSSSTINNINAYTINMGTIYSIGINYNNIAYITKGDYKRSFYNSDIKISLPGYSESKLLDFLHEIIELFNTRIYVR